MRRFFAVFLLMVLPLQFAFAAAAPYCALEKAQAAAHFGHHEHPDAPAPEPEPANDGDGKGKLHDCGICHLGAKQLHPATASVPAPSFVGTVRALPDGRQPQHLQEPAERPPRTSLA